MAGGALAATHLPRNSVGTRQLRRNAVVGAKIRPNAVNGAKVADGSLTGADIQSGSLTGAQIQSGSLTGAEVQDESLTAADIDTATLPRDFISFQAVLGPNQTKSVSFGNLTFSETADGTGDCTYINLHTGSKGAKLGGAGGNVLNEVAGGTIGLTGPTGGAAFYVIANSDGSDNLLVSIAAASNGGQCLTFGGIAPIS
jgi:uncharacterized protein YjbI with pentapeptide repeats